jgi:hypothetical protein
MSSTGTMDRLPPMELSGHDLLRATLSITLPDKDSTLAKITSSRFVLSALADTELSPKLESSPGRSSLPRCSLLEPSLTDVLSTLPGAPLPTTAVPLTSTLSKSLSEETDTFSFPTVALLLSTEVTTVSATTRLSAALSPCPP